MSRAATLFLFLRLGLHLGLLLGLAAGAGAREAAGLTLEPPLRGVNGQACFIQNYVDRDPGPGFRDYACGSLGYDGHTGTDFRPLAPGALRAGVEVLAAAPGVVRAVRDGMDDVGSRLSDPEVLEHSGGGNLVILDHAGGWSTVYAHLRKGSVRVASGQRVETGQVLGLVGLSGRTEFPHMELSVHKDGRPVDPFRGLAGGPECGPGDAPLWSPGALARLAYAPCALAGAGFAAAPPVPDPAGDGPDEAQRLSVLAPALIFWVQVLGVRTGDEFRLRLTGPDGTVLARHRLVMEQNEAQRLMYIGKQRRVAPWTPGAYTGEYALARKTASGERSVILRAVRRVEVR